MYPKLTARFWVFINGGWIKLSIPLNTTYTWRRSEETDEGYRVTCHSWSHWPDNEEMEKVPEVEWEYSCREKDCDGICDRSGTLTCPVEDLRVVLALGIPNAPGLLPNWKTEESHYRDHAAEAAGY